MVRTVWYGMYGMVWYGMDWYGMVWYGMVRRTRTDNRKSSMQGRKEEKKV